MFLASFKRKKAEYEIIYATYLYVTETQQRKKP